jgi:hypothetical protein
MKGHKINEGGIMKVGDFVKFRGRLGQIVERRVHNLSYKIK